MADDAQPRGTRSLVQLIRELPGLIVALLKAELEQLKRELIHKATNIGAGVALFAVAAMVLFWLLAVLITAAIAGIAVALPVWLSALIVAAGLLVVIAVLAIIGIVMFKRAGKPLATPGSVKADVNAVKGLGDYDR